MATLKSKRKQEEKIENLSKEVEKTKKGKSKKNNPDEGVVTLAPPTDEALCESPDIPAEETDVSPYMNEAEQTALAEQHEKDIAESKKVSIEKMQKAVEVAQEQFNLCDKNFSMNGFADKGSKCQLSMSNEDFDIVIVIKDTEKFGIV